jgi:transcriptional regulator with XRE-family HTH domain
MKSEGLGNYVSTRRKLFSFTQTDLAKSLGYTAQSISKFEAGESQISILVLPKLANLLNESLDDLLNQKANPAALSVPNPQFEERNLVANLIALRQKGGLSQSKEAEILGVTKRSIINYEQGESYPSLDALCRLLTYYKISAKAFYFEQIEPLSLSKITVVSTHKPLHGIWIGLIAFAGVALIVGCTSPLWVPSLNKAGSHSSSESTALSSNSASFSTSSDSSASSANDLSPYFPGLKEAKIQCDSSDNTVNLAPGTHTLSIVTTPTNYLTTNNVQFQFGFLTAHDGVTLSEDQLTIASYVSDQKNSLIRLTLTSTTGKTYIDESQKYQVSNPTGEIDSDNYPGITGFKVSLNGNNSATLKIGATIVDTTIETDSRCDLTLLDTTHFYFAHYTPGYTGDTPFGVKTVGTDLTHAEIDLASSLLDQTYITTNLILYRYNVTPNILSNPFYITVSNPA